MKRKTHSHRLATLLAVFSLFLVIQKVEAAKAAAPTAKTAAPAAATLEKIEIHTEVINGGTHWAPETLKVKAGHKYLLVAKHELKEGPDFHGLTINGLKISSQVNRGKVFEQEISIPATDKAGTTYDISCQFHIKHQAAKLIVE